MIQTNHFSTHSCDYESPHAAPGGGQRLTYEQVAQQFAQEVNDSCREKLAKKLVAEPLRLIHLEGMDSLINEFLQLILDELEELEGLTNADVRPLEQFYFEGIEFSYPGLNIDGLVKIDWHIADAVENGNFYELASDEKERAAKLCWIISGRKKLTKNEKALLDFLRPPAVTMSLNDWVAAELAGHGRAPLPDVSSSLLKKAASLSRLNEVKERLGRFAALRDAVFAAGDQLPVYPKTQTANLKFTTQEIRQLRYIHGALGTSMVAFAVMNSPGTFNTLTHDWVSRIPRTARAFRTLIMTRRPDCIVTLADWLDAGKMEDPPTIDGQIVPADMKKLLKREEAVGIDRIAHIVASFPGDTEALRMKLWERWGKLPFSVAMGAIAPKKYYETAFRLLVKLLSKDAVLKKYIDECGQLTEVITHLEVFRRLSIWELEQLFDIVKEYPHALVFLADYYLSVPAKSKPVNWKIFTRCVDVIIASGGSWSEIDSVLWNNFGVAPIPKMLTQAVIVEKLRGPCPYIESLVAQDASKIPLKLLLERKLFRLAAQFYPNDSRFHDALLSSDHIDPIYDEDHPSYIALMHMEVDERWAPATRKFIGSLLFGDWDHAEEMTLQLGVKALKVGKLNNEFAKMGAVFMARHCESEEDFFVLAESNLPEAHQIIVAAIDEDEGFTYNPEKLYAKYCKGTSTQMIGIILDKIFRDKTGGSKFLYWLSERYHQQSKGTAKMELRLAIEGYAGRIGVSSLAQKILNRRF